MTRAESGFGVELRFNARTPVLALRGELDLDSESQCQEALETALDLNSSLVLNLAELSFIGSTGLGLFIEARRTLEKRGQLLVLAEVQPNPRRVLETTGLDRAIPICDSEDDAVALAGETEPR